MQWSRDRSGVSPVVGTVLMLAIVVGVIAVIFVVGVPTVQRFRAGAAAEAALSSMRTLSGETKDLAFKTSARTASPTIDVPEGNLRIEPTRTRWAVSYSSNTSTRYNFTLDGLADGDHEYTVTSHPSTGVSLGSQQLTVRHTRWTEGRPETLRSDTIVAPADGDSETVTVQTRDGQSVGVQGYVLQIRIENASGGFLGGAWVVDSASVRYEGNLYTGPHRYEVVHGALVQDTPDADPRLEGFDVVRRTRLAGDTVSISLVRFDVGSGASLTSGAGRVIVPMRASPSLGLVEDEVRGNVTLSFTRTWTGLFRDHVESEAGFQNHTATSRTYVPGPVTLFLTDHRVELVEGLRRS